MIVLAGPNGAGKSTLFETRVKLVTAAPFINAEHIQKTDLDDAAPEAAYRAAALAAQRRAQCLADGRSFVTETVFSHPSKLELVRTAKRHGFIVVLMHVGVESPDLSVARVAERVLEGGHPVPERKIRDRFDRNGPIIRDAALLCDRAMVFDNSALNRPPHHLLTLTKGRLTKAEPFLPAWVRRIYAIDLAAR